jgi:hypothetical protein
MKLIVLIACVAVGVTGCSAGEEKVIYVSDKKNPVLNGTDTGGGGFSDQSAVDALNLAKHALAQRIENLPEEAFDSSLYKSNIYHKFGFPPGKRKEWLIKTIRNLSIKRSFEERYNKPLKFNYDMNSETIYATNYFVQSFSYGRFQTAPPKEKVRLIHEMFLDILHEISHLYGVGLSEKEDTASDTWARDFLIYGLDAFYVCENSDYLIKINKSTGIAWAYYQPTPEIKEKQHIQNDEYWRSFSSMFLYNQYEYLNENYANDIYKQYIALASMGGKKDIPKYIREDIFPHREGFLFSDNFKNLKLYKGTALGYPRYKPAEKKYVVSRIGIRDKDLFEINLDTLTATYNVGYRQEQEGPFSYDSEKELKFKCIDYKKPIVISVSNDFDVGDWWQPYNEE